MTRAQTILLPVFFLCTSLFSQTFTGRVVRVIDGDTISVLTGRTEVRIRLAECDAPESSQPFGYRAKQFTSSLVFGRDVDRPRPRHRSVPAHDCTRHHGSRTWI